MQQPGTRAGLYGGPSMSSRVNRVGASASSSAATGIYYITNPAYGASTASADNSGAIQAAINAASAAGGGVVFVPPGTFLCNSGINIKANVALRGDGPTVSILKIANSASGLFSIAKTDLSTNAQNAHQASSTFPVKCFLYTEPYILQNTKQSGISIEDLGVDGNGANQADSGSYANICITNTNRAMVRNVYSYNARPSLTTTGNNRAYCVLLCDDYQTTIRGGYYYGSGYDNIGGRAYSVGALLDGVVSMETSGTGSRASCQFAYQCCDFKIVGCWFENTATATSPVGFINHGCQRGSVTNTTIRSTNGNAVYVFGDNTDGSPDTNFDQNNLYPSATLDEYGDHLRFSGCEIEASGAVATFNLDTRFARNCVVTNTMLRHLAANAAVVLQIDGSAGSNSYANGQRRHVFAGCTFIQESTANVGLVTFGRNLVFANNTIMRDNSTNNGFLFSGCVGIRITNNSFHYTGTSNNMNVAYFIQQSAGNASDRFFISGNTFTKISSNITYGVYVDNTTTTCTNIRITENDFTNCTNPVTWSSAAGTGCWMQGNVTANTETKGTGTVANGATTTGNIAHGLTSWRTLIKGDILVTATNSLGTAVKAHVSSIDATNFVITVDADPGATTATFSWQGRANAA